MSQQPLDFPPHDHELQRDLLFDDLDVSTAMPGDRISGFESPEHVDRLITLIGQQIISLSNRGDIDSFASVEQYQNANAWTNYIDNSGNERSMRSLYSQKHLDLFEIRGLRAQFAKIERPTKSVQVKRGQYERSEWVDDPDTSPIRVRLLVVSDLHDSDGEQIGHAGTRLVIGHPRHPSNKGRVSSYANWEPYTLFIAESLSAVFPGGETVSLEP